MTDAIDEPAYEPTPAPDLNDRDTVLRAVKIHGLALENASERLKNDPEIVLAAIKQSHGRAVQLASAELLSNKSFIMAAVREEGSTLRYVTEELQNDRDCVLAAVSQC